MENLYIITDDNSHKCYVVNLVYNESTSSYSVYNISKNNVEYREYKNKKEFTDMLDGRIEAGLISNYYEIII